MDITRVFSGRLPVHRKYIDEIPEDYLCPICLVDTVASITPCGHSFCIACIYQHIANRRRQPNSVDCPMCRYPIYANQLQPVSQDSIRRIRRLMVHCVGMEQGCPQTGHLSQVELHEMACGYIAIVCQFREKGCMKFISRNKMMNHVSTCRYNSDVLYCPHIELACKFRGTMDLLEEHVKVCMSDSNLSWTTCEYEAPMISIWGSDELQRRNTVVCNGRVKKSHLSVHRQNCIIKNLSEICSKYLNIDGSQYSSQYYLKRKFYYICISLSRLSDSTMVGSNSNIKNELETILPNILKIRYGYIIGEIDIILQPLPIEAFSIICKIGDSQIYYNLAQQGFRFSGIRTLLDPDET